MAWQELLLDAIQKIDREQAPHGPYGMRELFTSGRKLAEWDFIFGNQFPRLDRCRRLGWVEQSWETDHYLRMHTGHAKSLLLTHPDGEILEICILDHASTKVRKYGDSYVLDKVYGKKTVADINLDSLMPRLKPDSEVADRVNALLLIPHAPTGRGLVKIHEKESSPEFPDRYDLEFTKKIWRDSHGRGFHTGLFFWNSRRVAV